MEELKRNDEIIGRLAKFIEFNKVSHSYIIVGEEGMGKMESAKEFAGILQCKLGGLTMCNKCNSCIQTHSDNHPDIRMVTHEKASIGVDDIRGQINSDIYIKPYASRYKVYIVENADKMTEAAQNALLKTIEEPPEYGIIMLLVNNLDTMLETIISRCVAVHMKPLSIKQIKNYLMKQEETPEYLADLAANFSGGNVGKAIQYARAGDFSEIREQSFAILKKLYKMNMDEIMDKVRIISKNKNKIDQYVDIFTLWYRDVLLFKATNLEDKLIFKEEIKEIKIQAEFISYDKIDEIMNSFKEFKEKLKGNVNFDIALELMLLKIKENSYGRSDWSKI